ncbi:MAG: c-type cytochrome [Sulfurimonadaceae bacterium]
MMNLKNIVVGVLTVAILGLMVMTFMVGGAYQGGEHSKIIEDFGDTMTQQTAAIVPEEKDDRAKEQEKLKALRDKAGSAGAFKVSQAYKSRCASCHGVNGSGEQNGKKLMGTKLFGQEADKIYTDLADFKAGRKENMIMKGLLMNLSEEDLRAFADEIGEFPARAKALEE